jgi:hypothetical protein
MSQTSGGLYERFFEEVGKPVDLEAGVRSSVRTSQTWEDRGDRGRARHRDSSTLARLGRA